LLRQHFDDDLLFRSREQHRINGRQMLVEHRMSTTLPRTETTTPRNGFFTVSCPSIFRPFVTAGSALPMPPATPPSAR
jgi:hypothetical protein